MPGAPALYVRLNAAGTPWHEDDVAAVAALAPLAGAVLPKAEDAATALHLAERLGGRPGERDVIALIETPRGLAAAREIARASARLAFGSIDFAVSIGARHVRPALDGARRELVLASALAGLPGPIDGVTADLSNEAATREDAAHAADLGFAGKLLVHPRQIAPALAGFMPTQEEIARARRVLDGAGGGAARVDGQMVDVPVLAWAVAVLSRARRGEGAAV